MIVRSVRPEDAEVLLAILNEIIAIGGTTAYETPLSKQDFLDHFLSGPDHIACLAAERSDGTLLGFQALERNPRLPDDCADIATFARQSPRIPGVGAALFQETRRLAAAQGFASINATIRADNAPGLAYYARMGFEDHSVDKAVPLQDGRPIDRISKRFILTR